MLSYVIYVWKRHIRKPVVAYLILAAAMTFAISRTYYDERALCTESHRRYDTLQAVVITSTSVSPIARQRLSKAQLAELGSYYLDLRTRLLAELGASPKC